MTSCSTQSYLFILFVLLAMIIPHPLLFFFFFWKNSECRRQWINHRPCIEVHETFYWRENSKDERKRDTRKPQQRGYHHRHQWFDRQAQRWLPSQLFFVFGLLLLLLADVRSTLSICFHPSQQDWLRSNQRPAMVMLERGARCLLIRMRKVFWIS